MSILTALHHASDNLPASTVGTAITSAVTTAGVVTQTIPVPEGTPPWLALLITIAGPVLTLVVSRLLAAHAARKRALAGAMEAKAARLQADKDPTNDAEAERLLEEAAAEKAEADALEALKPRK